MLTEPEGQSREPGPRDHSQNSQGLSDSAHQQIHRLGKSSEDGGGGGGNQQARFGHAYARTKQPGSQNPSKRLSQKSSARQFQRLGGPGQMSSSFSPGRKLQNMPSHVQH